MSELALSAYGTCSGCLGNHPLRPRRLIIALSYLFLLYYFLILCPSTATAPNWTCENETFVFAFSRSYFFSRICSNFIFEQPAGLLEYHGWVVVFDGTHNRLYLEPVLWIRIWIRSDPHHFDGFRSVHEKVDKLLVYFLPHNLNMLFKILKIMASLTLMRKVKHCKLAKLWRKVRNILEFSNYVENLG